MTVSKALIIVALFSGVAKAQGFILVGSPISGSIAGCTPNIVIVSSRATNFGASASSNTFVSGVTAGNLMILAFVTSTVNGTIKPSSTTTAVDWTARTKVTESGDGTQVQIFYGTANVSGTVVSSFTSTAGDGSVYLFQLSGMAVGNSYDTEASATNAGTDVAVVSSSFTTAQNSEFVISILGNEGTAITGMTPGGTVGTFTKIHQITANQSAVAAVTLTSIQTSKSAKWSWTTLAKTAIDVAAFKGLCTN